MPGATPAQFQNAEIDTPGRSLRTWVNGTQPNSNATRIDGAVSVNVWLPHHVGYVQPAETIETVNISTNNFDADQGMAGGAAVTVVTKSGTNELHGSAFFFRNQDEFNANTFSNNAFGLPKPPLAQQHLRRHAGRADREEQAVLLRRRGSDSRTAADQQRQLQRADREDAQRRFQRGVRGLLRPSASTTRHRRRRRRGRAHSSPTSTIPDATDQLRSREASSTTIPAPNTTQDLNSNRLPDDYVQARARSETTGTTSTSSSPGSAAPRTAIWAKFAMLDAEVVDNFSLGFDEGSLGDTRVYVGTIGHTWTLGADLVLDGNFGMNRQNQQVTGPDFGQNIGLGSRHPRRQRRQ